MKEATLNPRQRKFLKIYIQTGNASLSARKAGYKDYVVTPYKILDNARFQDAYQVLLEKKGITDGRLIETLDEGLKASKTIAVAGGEENNLISIPDHPTRHKFLETGLKLKKRLDDKTQDENGKQSVQVAVQIVHVRNADIPSVEGRSSDAGDCVVLEAGNGDGQHGEITSLVRRVQVG